MNQNLLPKRVLIATITFTVKISCLFVISPENAFSQNNQSSERLWYSGFDRLHRKAQTARGFNCVPCMHVEWLWNVHRRCRRKFLYSLCFTIINHHEHTWEFTNKNESKLNKIFSSRKDLIFRSQFAITVI